LVEDLPQIELGFSLLAILFMLAYLLMVLLFMLWFALTRLDSGVPLVGNCSSAISAACHPENDEGAYEKPVHWGVPFDPSAHTSDGFPGGDMQDQLGHCCLTSLPVTPPKVSRLIKYAGSVGE